MSKIDFKEISVFSGPELSPGFLLWHISTSWRSKIEKALKELDLTHPQFVVLASIAWITKDGNLVTQAIIGKLAGLDPNTLSQITKGLENKKLVKRVPCSDARVKSPILTEKGSKLLAKALPTVESKDAQFFEKLNSNEIENLIKLFQKLI